jgi:hypothetical protein
VKQQKQKDDDKKDKDEEGGGGECEGRMGREQEETLIGQTKVYYVNKTWVTNNHSDYSSDKTASNKGKTMNSQFRQFSLQNSIQVPLSSN